MGKSEIVAREIRFAVGRGGDLRSTVWRLWANKGDLFLAGRNLAGQSKISFHASGICRYAIVSQTPRPPIDRWMRPNPIQGITPVIELVVPDFQVRNAFRDKLPPAEKKLGLIEAPGRMMKRIIRIFLTDPNFTELDVLNIPRSSPLSFHGQVPLDRKIAWLVSFGGPLSQAEREFLTKTVSTTRINLKPGSSPDGVFAYMHIYESAAPRRIIDVQLGPGNIFVDSE
jgi:hypothetical protein